MRIVGLKPSATLAINEKCAELINQGREIYRLGFGQSPFPVPDIVVQSLQANAAKKDYLPVKGLATLRQAIADRYRSRYGLPYTAEDVLIAPGSKELLFLLQLTQSWDLLLPSPSWVSYEPQATIAAKSITWLNTREEDKWLLTAERLEEQLADRTSPNGALLILNYPSNPAGSTYSDQQLKALAGVLEKYQINVISDEIYGELAFNGAHQSIAAYYPKGTIISTGLSKWCGAGGWRLGAFLFPDSLRPVLNDMAVVASETYTSTSAPIQFAALTAYQEDVRIAEYLGRSIKVLTHIAQYSYSSLLDFGITMPKPEGGFYLFPNFENYRKELVTRGIHGSTTLCQQLLEDTGVALLPGTDFGRPEGELTARLSYVDFDGRNALDTIDETSDIERLAPNVRIAIERIQAWVNH